MIQTDLGGHRLIQARGKTPFESSSRNAQSGVGHFVSEIAVPDRPAAETTEPVVGGHIADVRDPSPGSGSTWSERESKYRSRSPDPHPPNRRHPTNATMVATAKSVDFVRAVVPTECEAWSLNFMECFSNVEITHPLRRSSTMPYDL